MLTENMIANMKTADLETIIDDDRYTEAEKDLAEKEIDRREFGAADKAAIYGAAGRHDDELEPLPSYSS